MRKLTTFSLFYYYSDCVSPADSRIQWRKKKPYAVIARLQYIMCLSIVLFMVTGGNQPLYILVAVLFGIGASYPILVAMAANDANPDLIPHTLQLFALSYFAGIFGFPLVAGWIITESQLFNLLLIISVLAFLEATMALTRSLKRL